MTFLTITDLKTALNVSSLSVIRNPKTDKLFVANDSGTVVLRCEQAIDTTLPMRYMYEGQIQDGCLVNVTPNTDNVVATL